MTPRFSILTPVHDPPIQAWRRCVESVLNQSETDWEWVLVDDGSTDPQVQQSLDGLVADRRVRLVRRETSGGIVSASNEGLAVASGEYVALLDHDDELHPEALREVDALLRLGADMVYTDEDVIDPQGVVADPMRKPGWSPTRLRAHNYINHLTVARTSLVREVGGFTSGADGAQDHDLVLRVGERAAAVYHLPKPLYRWHMAETSVLTQGLGGKPYAWEAGRRAVQAHCDRIGLEADVEELVVSDLARWYHVRPRLTRFPSVAAVVPVTGREALPDPDSGRRLALRASRSLAETWSPEVPGAIVLALAEDVSDEDAELLRQAAGERAVLARVDGEPTPARLGTRGALAVDAEVYVFCDPAVQLGNGEWARSLVGGLTEPGVGIVGGRLTAGSGVLAHAGFALVDGVPQHLMRGLPVSTTAYGGAVLVPGERSAVSGALMAVTRGLFEDLGGFSASYTSGLDDVDFCLKARRHHHRVVYTPLLEASVPGGTELFRREAHEPDLAQLHRRWGTGLGGDPYVHPEVAHDLGTYAWPRPGDGQAGLERMTN